MRPTRINESDVIDYIKANPGLVHTTRSLSERFACSSSTIYFKCLKSTRIVRVDIGGVIIYKVNE